MLGRQGDGDSPWNLPTSAYLLVWARGGQTACGRRLDSGSSARKPCCLRAPGKAGNRRGRRATWGGHPEMNVELNWEASRMDMCYGSGTGTGSSDLGALANYSAPPTGAAPTSNEGPTTEYGFASGDTFSVVNGQWEAQVPSLENISIDAGTSSGHTFPWDDGASPVGLPPLCREVSTL
jgi:hypothetical protein